MVSPGGVGLRLRSCFTIGGGVGSRIFSTLRCGGDTLHESPTGADGGGGGQPPAAGGGGGQAPQDISNFLDRYYFVGYILTIFE
jgi:hypothetical protein